MKRNSLIAIGVLTLCSAAGYAQPQSPGYPLTPIEPAMTQTLPAAPAPVQIAPAAPTTTEAPKPILIETSVDLTTEPGPPADLHAAREEAVNALHWAKTEGCRSDPSPRDCVRHAQDEYNRVIAQLGGRR